MKYLELLNEKYGEKYDFLRVRAVNIDTEKRTVQVTMLYPYEMEEKFTDDERGNIEKHLAMMIPFVFKLELTFRKSYADEDILRKTVVDFFSKVYPTVGNKLTPSDISVEAGKVLGVKISVYDTYYEYLKKYDIEQQLKLYLSHYFCDPSSVKVLNKGELAVGERAEQALVEFRERKIDVKPLNCIIGKEIVGSPMYLCDLKNPVKNAVVCGKIENFTRRTAKSGNLYYTFSVNDTTGRITCKYFTKVSENGALDGFDNNMEVMIEGPVDNDAFIKDLALLVRRMSLCSIDYTSIVTDTGEGNVEYDDYIYVRPQKFTDSMQQTLFDREEDIKPPLCLMDREYVVFDFEATGKDKLNDRPIEIGAVKMREGVIVETFESFVNPQKTIPQEVVELTSITQDMVKDAPLWKEVLPDFYKFAKGCVLVAHNIDYDYNILRCNSKEHGYTFTNPQIDTLALSRKYVRSANHKLITVCNYLGIELEGAHRAVNDAIATAKLLTRLARDHGLD